MRLTDSDILFEIVKGMYEESIRHCDDESAAESKSLWNVLNEIANTDEIKIDGIPAKWISYKIRHLKEDNNSNMAKNYEQILKDWQEDRKFLEALGMDICDLYVRDDDSEEENDEQG